MQPSDITAEVGHTFDIGLQLSAGTGYSWVLAKIPNNVSLMDVSTTTSDPVVAGGPVVEHFIFVATSSDKGEVTFNLIRPWIPEEIAETKTFSVTVLPRNKKIVDALKEAAGQGRFLSQNSTHTSLLAPCPPYGFPGKTDCIDPAPGGGIQPKYGFPITMKYGYPPILKYGILPPTMLYAFPVHPLYGYPVPVDNTDK